MSYLSLNGLEKWLPRPTNFYISNKNIKVNSNDQEATQLKEEDLRALARDDSEAVKNLGNKAYEKGDLVRAKQLYLLAAEAGNATALNNLGVLAKNSHNLEEAREYFLQALAKYQANDAPGELIGMTQYNLGLIDYQENSYDEAQKWWLQAASKDHLDAIYNLGVLFDERGDVQSAKHWLSQAAKLGDDRAMNHLGTLDMNLENYQESQDWFMGALNQDNYLAPLNLAILSRRQSNFHEALEWLEKWSSIPTPNEWSEAQKNSTSNQIKASIVIDRNCPHYLIARFVKDPSEEIRIAIAQNPACPVDVLELLSEDPDFQVRLKLAQREDCPESVLKRLAGDKSKRVKEWVAKRKDLPEKIRRDLNQQGFANAEEILLNKSGDELTYEDVIKVKVVQERANLVKMITDSDTLLALAKDSSTTVRFEVAENINTPDDALKTILELCRGDYSTGVNATIINRVITHPNCTEETLKIAANISNGFNLTLFFERSPAISLELFLHVLNFIDIGAGFAKIAKKNFKIRSQEFNEEHWRALATHANPAVRALVAASPNSPQQFYEILAMDESQRVRDAVKGNKKAPETARAAAALLS